MIAIAAIPDSITITIDFFHHQIFEVTSTLRIDVSGTISRHVWSKYPRTVAIAIYQHRIFKLQRSPDATRS